LERIVALGGQARPERGDLGVEAGSISRIFEDIVGTGCFFLVRDLMGQADTGVCFGGEAGRAG